MASKARITRNIDSDTLNPLDPRGCYDIDKSGLLGGGQCVEKVPHRRSKCQTNADSGDDVLFFHTNSMSARSGSQLSIDSSAHFATHLSFRNIQIVTLGSNSIARAVRFRR